MNNELIIIFCMFCQCYCWTLHPERGRKLAPPWLASLARLLGSSLVTLLDSSPREGTETLCITAATYTVTSNANCWTLHPERGRKLPDRLSRYVEQSRQIVGLFTPRGDGNASRSASCLLLRLLLDSLPREGTETLIRLNSFDLFVRLLDSSPREGTET